MSEKIRIFDTTLRDGEQSPGCSMNLGEKLALARQLEKLGVDVIEAGFPIASEGDFESVRRVAEAVRGPSICGLARTGRADVERAAAAVEPAASPRIHTFIATSDIHLKHKLRMSRAEVLEEVVGLDLVDAGVWQHRQAVGLGDDLRGVAGVDVDVDPAVGFGGGWGFLRLSRLACTTRTLSRRRRARLEGSKIWVDARLQHGRMLAVPVAAGGLQPASTSRQRSGPGKRRLIFGPFWLNGERCTHFLVFFF